MKNLYAALFIILLATSPGHAQWQQIISGLPGYSVYGLAADGQYIYAGMSTAGVYRSSNKGNNWVSVNNGLPAGNAWELYSNNNTLFVGFYGSGAFRSTNHGNTWDTLLVGLSNSSVRGYISNNNYLFAATWGQGIFRSSNGGNNWSPINSGLNNQTFWDIFSIQDTLLVAGSGIYRSTNNGNSWTQSNTGLTDLNTYRIASAGNYIYLGTAYSGVFRSSDFGKSWLQIGLTSQTIYALLSYNTLLFAGTANAGIFISSDYGNTWETFNQGNPIGSVVELIYDDTYLYAATLGGGVYRYDKNNITSVENTSTEIPTSFSLSQNYPNPFNPSTSIQYAIGSSQFVTLKVYDVLGNEVATLVNEEQAAGSYEIDFSAKGGSASGGDAYNLSSGIYFYTLNAGIFTQTKKLVLLK